MFVFPGTVSYVHQGSSVVQQVEINQVVIVMVVGTVSVVHGHHNLYILVVVHLIPHLVSVQTQQLVGNVNLENIVLLVLHNQYHAKKVLLNFPDYPLYFCADRV